MVEHKMSKPFFLLLRRLFLETDTFPVVQTIKQNIQPKERNKVSFTELSIQQGTTYNPINQSTNPIFRYRIYQRYFPVFHHLRWRLLFPRGNACIHGCLVTGNHR